MIKPETQYVPGAHETFPFRTSWLKKGYDAVRKDPMAFTRDDAVVCLGVGKNMVRSIRFWCLATGVVVEEPRPTGCRPLVTTRLGDKLLADDGWDPYLEDLASLWLIHWLLVTNVSRASAWWHAFYSYPDNEFTKTQLVTFLQNLAASCHKSVSPASIARDVDCFLRTYAPGTHPASSFHDGSFDCPLAELGIVRVAHPEAIYRFHLGPKKGLCPNVVGFALLRYFRTYGLHRRSLKLHECLYAQGSPGPAFRLDEDSLLACLSELPLAARGLFDVVETAGLTQIYIHVGRQEDIDGLSLSLLDDYYSRRRSRAN